MAAALCVAASFGVGCSKSPYELAPVSGRVTIDGWPVTQAKVMFAPIERGADNPNPGKPAFGLLQDDGSFVLTTYQKNDGAVVGDHWVTITRLRRKPGDPAAASASPLGVSSFDQIAVPTKVTVAGDTENRIDLKLSAQDVARYGMKVRD